MDRAAVDRAVDLGSDVIMIWGRDFLRSHSLDFLRSHSLDFLRSHALDLVYFCAGTHILWVLGWAQGPRAQGRTLTGRGP